MQLHVRPCGELTDKFAESRVATAHGKSAVRTTLTRQRLSLSMQLTSFALHVPLF